MAPTAEQKSIIIKLAKDNPAQFGWHLFQILKDPENISMTVVDGSFLFRHNTTISTFGHLGTIKNLLQKYPFEIGERLKIIFPSHHLPVIKKRFENFDLLDESGSGDFNNLQIMELEKSVFVPRRQAKNGKKLKKDLIDQLTEDENLIEFVKKGGIAYGIIEDAELRSYASVPYILQNPRENLSFAILDKLWTHPDYRGQGYATGSVRSVFNFLFTRKAIKHIYAWIEEKNEPANLILDSLGFSRSGMEWIGTMGFVKDIR